MLVCLNESASIVSNLILKGVLLKHDLKLLKVNWDWVLADYDSRVVFHIFNLTEPNVTTNVGSCESLGRVSVEDFLNKISAIFTDKLWNSVISVENFLIEHVSLGVLKGEIAADHCVQDDTT